MITTRTPEALRPKVLTAVITFAMLAGPLGLIVVGPLLQNIGPQPVFGLVAAGELAAALVFAFVALRHHEAPLQVSEAMVEPG